MTFDRPLVGGPPAFEAGDQARHRAFFELLVSRLIRWMAGVDNIPTKA